MLNVVETSTKNILPLPFLFVDITWDFVREGFCPTANHLIFGGDSVRGDYVRDSNKTLPCTKKVSSRPLLANLTTLPKPPHRLTRMSPPVPAANVF